MLKNLFSRDRRSRGVDAASGHGGAPAVAYLRLAEGPGDVADEQRSLTRKVWVMLAVAVLVYAALMFASTALPDNPVWKPEAGVALAAGGDDDCDDDSDDDSDDSGSGKSEGSGSGHSDSGNSDSGDSDSGDSESASGSGHSDSASGSGDCDESDDSDG